VEIEATDRVQARHRHCAHDVAHTEAAFGIAKRRDAADGLVVGEVTHARRAVEQLAGDAHVIDALARSGAGLADDFAVDLDFTGRDQPLGLAP
jgi:hypothetical protein